MDLTARITASLLAGAYGDALGAPVEFTPLTSMPAPAELLVRLPHSYGVDGAITDDTQMTLFTAEGLLRAGPGATLAHQVDAVACAHARWALTQGETPARDVAGDGWLSRQSFLHARRAPGNTCLAAVRSGAPVPGSAGCGGVMRAAPAGLTSADPVAAYRLGTATAAISHGHPRAWVPAGLLAATVSQLLLTTPGPTAVEQSVRHACTVAMTLTGPAAAGPVALVHRALDLARTGPTAQDLEALGGGWDGDEAFAIAVAVAAGVGSLGADSTARALVRSVRHGGDSDSTGAITGNLLGAAGAELPDACAHVEGADIVEQVAADLADLRFGLLPDVSRWPQAPR